MAGRNQFVEIDANGREITAAPAGETVRAGGDGPGQSWV